MRITRTEKSPAPFGAGDFLSVGQPSSFMTMTLRKDAFLQM